MPLDDASAIRARQQVLGFLSDNAVHSGHELAATLGLSHSAVQATLQTLEKLGLDVHAVPGQGYHLPHPVEMLDADTLQRHLHPLSRTHIGRLDLHPHLDSTNTRLMQQARAGTACSGQVCLADSQGAGRGRMGRDWISPPGANVYLSLLWQFENPASLTGLSLALGVAVARALQAEHLTGVNLKWPNDILWQDKKLGGILIEATGTVGGGCQVVIGLGLNRYIPPRLSGAIDQAFTDLYRIQGQAMPSRNRLIAQVLNEMIPLLVSYPQCGLATWLDEWKTLHHWTGREVTLIQGERQVQGVLDNISGQGLLILRTPEGTLHEFGSGDVRLKRSASAPL